MFLWCVAFCSPLVLYGCECAHIVFTAQGGVFFFLNIGMCVFFLTLLECRKNEPHCLPVCFNHTSVFVC